MNKFIEMLMVATSSALGVLLTIVFISALSGGFCNMAEAQTLITETGQLVAPSQHVKEYKPKRVKNFHTSNQGLKIKVTEQVVDKGELLTKARNGNPRNGNLIRAKSPQLKYDVAAWNKKASDAKIGFSCKQGEKRTFNLTEGFLCKEV